MAFELHFPVLLKEVLEYLDCQKEGLYMDGTFGAGGYTKAILNANASNKVISFDRDPTVQHTVNELKKIYPNRFSFVQDCFSNL